MERGEVDGRCGISWDTLQALNADWLRDKKIRLLVQIGLDEFDTVGDSVKPPARAGGAHQCHDLLIRFDQLTHDLGADEPAGAGD